MKPISKEKSKRIISLLEFNYSLAKIAKIVAVSKSTVFKIKKEHNIVTKNNQRGRPPKLNDKDKRQIVRTIISGKISTAVEAAKNLSDSLNIHIHPETIRQTLKNAALRSIIKKKKPKLSKKHRRERMIWAEKYKNWAIDDWHRVIWSDETKINLLGSDGIKRPWKKPNSSLQDHHIIPTIKYGGGSLML